MTTAQKESQVTMKSAVMSAVSTFKIKDMHRKRTTLFGSRRKCWMEDSKQMKN